MSKFYPWKSQRWGDPAVNLERCRSSVYGGQVTTHQCTRKARTTWTDPETGESFGFCKQHHPDAAAAKRAAQEEKWRTEMDASTRKYERQRLAHEIADRLAAGEAVAFDDVMVNRYRELLT